VVSVRNTDEASAVPCSQYSELMGVRLESRCVSGVWSFLEGGQPIRLFTIPYSSPFNKCEILEGVHLDVTAVKWAVS